MGRPRHEQPTIGELEVLKVLWDRGPSTVRDVLEVVNRKRRRAYTSVMSLLNVMTQKGLLDREPHGRAFMYTPRHTREATLRDIVGDLLSRAFDGSTSGLVAHLLDESRPDAEELEEIRRTINAYRDAEPAARKGGRTRSP